jgi:tRNA A58 N-methylase Trm61
MNPHTLTMRRIQHLGLEPGARCLEVGGGRGSIAAWLCRTVGPAGQVTATDLQTTLLSRLDLPNLTVLRHDIRTDDFPAAAFDLVHGRNWTSSRRARRSRSSTGSA